MNRNCVISYLCGSITEILIEKKRKKDSWVCAEAVYYEYPPRGITRVETTEQVDKGKLFCVSGWHGDEKS